MQYPQKTVYLCGPITGLSYGDTRHGWREDFDRLLHAPGDMWFTHIHCVSPMRGKQHLKDEQRLSGDVKAYDGHLLSRSKGITTRDRYDVRNCDVMVANFLGAEKASVGSCIELGWADAYDIPVVMLIEDEGFLEETDGLPRGRKNPHWHMIVNEIAGYVTSSMEEAVFVVRTLCTPEV